ncbi:MAG: class I SAM-dependent methyltransferase [Magnetococcales bacterium]|nr:class I SAM-dependent methyltransferase [Magnetococcales bacterium]MBF0117175.1 class I SAM-dependent methyltransferase [Magnetococcales bacterium]
MNWHFHIWRRSLLVLKAFPIHRWPGVLTGVFYARLSAWWFDLRHGVTTRTLIPPEYMTMSAEQRGQASRHQPVEQSLFEHIMSHLPPMFWSEYLFVDMGAGLGKAMLLAARYPWQEIIGVELAPELCTVLERNLIRYRDRHPEMPPWRIVNCDASVFEFPDTPLIVFFFDPFRDIVFTSMMTNLTRRVYRTDAPVWIMYVNPVEDLAIPIESFVRIAGQAGENISGKTGWQLYQGVYPGSASARHRHSLHREVVGGYVAGTIS